MKLRPLVVVPLLVVGAGACSSDGRTLPERGSPDVSIESDVDVAATLGELDDIAVTVAPEDLRGELIVIGDDPASSDSAAETALTIAPELDAAGVEPQDVAPELNPLGGDDPEDDRMPDVLCMNLQDAQDEIQDRGVLFSKSRDATGKGRSQLWDRNWIVVEQSPEPGDPIGENEAVLSVVKKGEPSDC